MTDELGTNARVLLDAAREGLSPDAAAVERVRARISIATGGAAAGATLGVKLALVTAVAALVAGVGVYASRSTKPVMPGHRVASSVTPPREAAVPEPAVRETAAREAVVPETAVREAAVPEPAAPAPAVPDVVSQARDDELIMIDPPAPSPRAPARSVRPASHPRGASPPDVSARAPRARTVDLAREVELVDLAMTALRRGDAPGALDAVKSHTAETAGRGQLAEDAAAIEIEALCRLHDPATAAKLAAFDVRFPRSAQRSRLTTACR